MVARFGSRESEHVTSCGVHRSPAMAKGNKRQKKEVKKPKQDKKNPKKPK